MARFNWKVAVAGGGKNDFPMVGKWRTINYKMKAPPAPVAEPPRNCELGKQTGKPTGPRGGGGVAGREEREIHSYVGSICAVCCLSAMGIGLDWIAASAIQTLEASMWVGLSRSCFKLKLHFPGRPGLLPFPPVTSLRYLAPFFPSRVVVFFARHRPSVEDFAKAKSIRSRG